MGELTLRSKAALMRLIVAGTISVLAAISTTTASAADKDQSHPMEQFKSDVTDGNGSIAKKNDAAPTAGHK
jgi:hypothetical protein